MLQNYFSMGSEYLKMHGVTGKASNKQTPAQQMDQTCFGITRCILQDKFGNLTREAINKQLHIDVMKMNIMVSNTFLNH